jgi:DNA-binding beta-propeller fold protein YncE
MNFGVQGGGPGKLAFPIDVVVDNHGHLLVLDQQRHCVSVYDPTGQYLTEFGGMGAGPGWFFFPKSLEIDKYGRIYVSQTFGNRVQVLKLKEELE